MAAYGKGQMLGSGINPESFKLDFGGFADAARMQAQGLSNLGQSIGGAIQNYGEVKKEQKKVDAYNKASAKSIEAAITLGKSYGITAAEETLSPFLQSYNDPNLSPIEKAALLDEGKAMIPNVFGRFDKDQAMAIDKAQLLSRGTSSTSPMSNAKLVEIAVPGGTQQMFLRDGVLEPIQLNQQTGGVEFPAIGSDAIDQAINLNNIPSGAGTENLPPTGDGAPEYDPTATNILLGQGGVGFIPSKPETVETFRPFTSEEVALYGSQGQVSSTGRVYPIRPPSGTEFTTNPDGSTTYRQGAGVGGKAAQAQRAEDAKVDKAMGLIQDLNLLEKASESMTPGVLGAAGRMVAEQIPATQQAETKDIIDRVNSTLTLSGIQEMRANNPTGAALGSVSDKDMGVLRSSVTALRNAQSPAAFKRELVRLKNLQHDLIYGSERVLKSKLDKGEITQSQFSQAMANAPTEYLDKEGEIKSRTAPESVPTSGSSNIYEKYGVK
jgi:hypothetical protein